MAGPAQIACGAAATRQLHARLRLLTGMGAGAAGVASSLAAGASALTGAGACAARGGRQGGNQWSRAHSMNRRGLLCLDGSAHCAAAPANATGSALSMLGRVPAARRCCVMLQHAARTGAAAWGGGGAGAGTGSGAGAAAGSGAVAGAGAGSGAGATGTGANWGVGAGVAAGWGAWEVVTALDRRVGEYQRLQQVARPERA